MHTNKVGERAVVRDGRGKCQTGARAWFFYGAFRCLCVYLSVDYWSRFFWFTSLLYLWQCVALSPKKNRRSSCYITVSTIFCSRSVPTPHPLSIHGEEEGSWPPTRREQENKKVINLFLVSLSLCSTTLFSGCSREASLSLSVYHSHSTVIVFCSWSLTFFPKSVAKILQEKKSKKFFSLSTNPLLL